MPGVSQGAPQANATAAHRADPAGKGLIDRLFAPVSVAPLVYFRIAFGALLVWSISMFFSYKDEHGTDHITRYFTEPVIHFKYYGFGWVEALSDRDMHVLFFALGAAAVCVTVGLLYRAATAAFCLGFTYVFLLEQTRYMNHYYLVCLVCLLLVFLPAHRACSLDAFLLPSIRSATAPAWTLWLLRFQFGIVYFYAGLAKCHRDWIDGTIMQMKLARRTETPVFGPLFAQDWAPVVFSWGGLLLDLGIVPLLLWRKTRIPALAAALAFHLLNSQLFHIDIFPWMMLAATMILFFPDWLPWFEQGSRSAAGSAVVPAPRRWSSRRRIGLALLSVYVAVQLLVPLRHVFYAGDADWTEDGQQFAWRMLMREKRVEPPRFFASYRIAGRLKQERIPIPHPTESWFWNTDWQFQKMAISPDMILQLCHKYADLLRRQGADQIDIRAQVLVSLNGREPRPLVDSTVNLANEPRRWLSPYPWVLPFDRNAPRLENLDSGPTTGSAPSGPEADVAARSDGRARAPRPPDTKR